MNSSFSVEDERYMSLALEQAGRAADEGSYPVGAVLTVDENLFAQARNTVFTDGRWTAHAEHNLLYEQSKQLRDTLRGRTDVSVRLYTTLEPCLMCLDTAVMHRVSDLIVACPDPSGGTLKLDKETLGSFYQRHFPRVQVGLYREEACDLMIAFIGRGKLLQWQTMLTEFEEMRNGWRR